MGGFNELGKSAPQATVILKCGTARIGPWNENIPIGSWWKDHEAEPISHDMLEALLDAGSAQAEEHRGHLEQSDSNSTSLLGTSLVDSLEESFSKTGLDDIRINAYRHLQAARRYCRNTKAAPIDEVNVLTTPNVATKEAPIDELQVPKLSSDVGNIIVELQTAVHDVNDLLHDLGSVGDSSGMKRICQQKQTSGSFCKKRPSQLESKIRETHTGGISKLLNFTSDITLPNEASDSETKSLAKSGSGLAEKRRKEQIASLATWLGNEVICYDADKAEMELYATRFRDYGLSSVKMVQDVCTENDVKEFDWMPKVHKVLFILRGIKSRVNWDDPEVPSENASPLLKPTKRIATALTTAKKNFPRMLGASR